MEKYDLIVIGAGVLGTFHAYHAIKNGLKVALIEQNLQAQDASVRNFGHIIPSAMNTKWQAYGRESMDLYKRLQKDTDISVRQNGSVYIASNNEELQLLEELKQINIHNDYNSKLLTKSECLSAYAGLKESYCKGGLYFPEEITVEPRLMIYKMHVRLKQLGVHMVFNTKIISCEPLTSCVKIRAANGKAFRTEKVIVCNGHDFKSLYPEKFQQSDLVVSKLQMMQTQAQKNYVLQGSVLSGLAIKNYDAFTECASFAKVKEVENTINKDFQSNDIRSDSDSFFQNGANGDKTGTKWGVHILFKQAIDGSVIIGNSHEYAMASEADNLSYELNMEIDNYMLSEAKKIMNLPNYTINQRWIGMYSQCKFRDLFQEMVDTNVHVVTGIGSKGITTAAGLAKENIQALFNI